MIPPKTAARIALHLLKYWKTIPVTVPTLLKDCDADPDVRQIIFDCIHKAQNSVKPTRWGKKKSDILDEAIKLCVRLT